MRSGSWPITTTTGDSPAATARRPSRQGCRRGRSEEHTSELQSQFHLVCRLLHEKNNGLGLREFSAIVELAVTRGITRDLHSHSISQKYPSAHAALHLLEQRVRTVDRRIRPPWDS